MYKMEEVFELKRRSLDIPFLQENQMYDPLTPEKQKIISATQTNVRDVQY